MLLQFIYRKHRRAVSPVIASLLMIALSIAAASVVVVLLNQINTRDNVADDPSFGNAEGSNDGFTPPFINVTGIERSANLVAVGVNDYVKISVDVKNNAPTDLYIFDIDVWVYGSKLDEVSSWDIKGHSGASYTTDGNGNFAGYRQNTGEVGMYSVEVDDASEDNARIPVNASFVYEVIYGSGPNVVSGSVEREQRSQIMFAPVWFDVAILHSGSSFASSTAAGQYENSLQSLNSTNKVYFKYDRNTDAYDYVNSPGSIDGTYISNNYDVVIVDVWAVPAAISSAIQVIHNNQTSLIFYGSVSSLGNSRAEILAAIDIPVTEEVTGLTPMMFGGASNLAITDHSYRFTSGSSVVSGLENAFFEELEDETWVSNNDRLRDWLDTSVCGAEESYVGIGDRYGYDIANLTGTGNFAAYGYADWKFLDDTPALIESHLSTPLIVEKYNDTNFGENKSLVYSFVWKHNNDLNPNAILVDNAHLRQIRTNMLADVASQSERVITTSPGVSIDSFSVITPTFAFTDQRFDMTVSGTILNEPVENGEITVSIDMPQYAFHDCTPSYGFYDSFGSLEVNSVNVVTDAIVIVIGAENIVTVDISEYYTGTLEVGDTFKLKIAEPSLFSMFNMDIDRAVKNWTVTVDTGPAFAVSRTFQRSVDGDADNQEPNQITDLSISEVTSNSIGLSWTDPGDNVGVVSYKVFRNDVLISSNVQSTSYLDFDLPSNTFYKYKVVAVDGAGIESQPSNIVNATTLSGTPPPAVTTFTGTSLSSTRIQLSWTGPSNIDGYWIFRNGEGPIILSSGTTTYEDTYLNPATLYSYEIYAVNNSILSSVKTTDVTTDPSPNNPMWISQLELNYQRIGGWFGSYEGEVTFTISDGNGLVRNTELVIDVTYTVDGGSDITTTIIGTTNNQGQITYNVGRVADSFALTVLNMVEENHSYDLNNPLGVTTLVDSDGPRSGVTNP